MFIPFTLYNDMTEARQGTFSDKIRKSYWHHEQLYGIVFDRLRIAHLAHACVAGGAEWTQRVDGMDCFDQISAWLGDTLEVAGLGNAA